MVRYFLIHKPKEILKFGGSQMCAPSSILCTIQKPVDTKLKTIRRSCTYTGKKERSVTEASRQPIR